MVNNNKKIYKFFKKHSGIKQRIEFFDVDFEKSWYLIFFKKPFQFSLVIVSETLQSVFGSLSPLILGLSLSQLNYQYLLLYVVVYFVLEIINRISLYYFATAFSSIQGSLLNACYTYFLTVDPIYHSTKSTGTIQSKIEATGRQLSFTIDILLFSLIDIVVGYFTVVVALGAFSNQLALIGIGSFLAISLASFYGHVVITKVFMPFWIIYRDKIRAIATENLFQNSFIRASFSTTEQISKTIKYEKIGFEARSIMVLSRSILTFVTRLLITGSVVWMVIVMIELISQNKIDSTLAIALLLTYMAGTRQITRVGQTVANFSEGVEDMNDLWDYIRTFGKQTYPVIDKDVYEK
ncbi:ABC transporter ATP-binding protein [Candidatus Gracilibacteria bacterium]|nr:ABC transporter ATP-binding protein [Candidatus Gracilibacteria bacterium]